MGSQRTISPLGLKLIKVFEGYRSEPARLVTGQHVIGYGHPLEDDETAKTMSREVALNLLREDLAPVEAMIRETVFSPLSQGQFDALCSLIFNIGPVNFMTSNIRHALNNGRVLDAASAFDEWRKADIDGKTYVVDALVRRRTAEKALFLRAETGSVRAANGSMNVRSDRTYARISDDEVFEPDAGIVNAPLAQSRRAEDRGGVLTLTERAQTASEGKNNAGRSALDTGDGGKSVYDPINYADEGHMDAAIESYHLDIPHPNSTRDDRVQTADTDPSPIALAAAEVSDRLDALIDTARMDTEDAKPAPRSESDNKLPIAANSNEGRARRPQNPGEDRSKQFITSASKPLKPANQASGAGVYGLFMFIGGCLLAGGFTVWMTARNRLSDMGELLTPLSMILGGLLLLGGFYYGLRAVIRSRRPGKLS